MQSRVATCRRPLHQEVARAIAKDEVRDDLLERGVALHLGPRLVASVALDRSDERRRARRFGGRTTPAPSGTADRGTTKTRSSLMSRPFLEPRLRAPPGAPGSPRSSGPSGALELEAPVARGRRRGRAAGRASAAAFVTAMPAPIAGSPRARRVMSRQPPAASPAAIGQSRPRTRFAHRRRPRRAPPRAPAAGG